MEATTEQLNQLAEAVIAAIVSDCPSCHGTGIVREKLTDSIPLQLTCSDCSKRRLAGYEALKALRGIIDASRQNIERLSNLVYTPIGTTHKATSEARLKIIQDLRNQLQVAQDVVNSARNVVAFDWGTSVSEGYHWQRVDALLVLRKALDRVARRQEAIPYRGE